MFQNSNIFDFSKIDQPIQLQLRVLHGFVRDVAKGLHHLHSSNIIHRDMAARNICKDDCFYFLNCGFNVLLFHFELVLRTISPTKSTAVISDSKKPKNFDSKTDFNKTSNNTLIVGMARLYDRQEQYMKTRTATVKAFVYF